MGWILHRFSAEEIVAKVAFYNLPCLNRLLVEDPKPPNQTKITRLNYASTKEMISLKDIFLHESEDISVY